MSMLAESITALISIQFKRRHDTLTDLYNRLLMVKLCMICSIVIGFNYYTNKTSCIIPEVGDSGREEEGYSGFIETVCWIQGFYIFKEMDGRLDESGYYGIPKNMDYDGLNSLGQLCTVKNRAGDIVQGCEPMEKVYYLQYQYMPFFIAALSLLFYLPYVVYKHFNLDMVSLGEAINKQGVTAEDLYEGFFDRHNNTRRRMQYRFLLMIAVKLLYFLANLVTFLLIDATLNNRFKNYGIDYINWLKFENFQRHNHILKERVTPKPANMLLPAMGYCDIHEASRDVRNTFINAHRIICEISPHVLYHYVLLVFWFLLIIGMILSLTGLIVHGITIILSYIAIRREDSTGRLYRYLTMREIDYLDYLREKNSTTYKEMIEKIKACNGIIDFKRDKNSNVYGDMNKTLLNTENNESEKISGDTSF